MSGVWRFGSAQSGAPTLPSPAEVKKLRALIDYRKVELDTKGARVRIPKGRKIGLGGIAKGYIVDRAVDVLRKEGRMSRLDDGAVESDRALGLPAEESRPGRALEAAETREALLGLIGRLPPNQQEVIRLKFQTGFSYKEISRITELSVSNVGFLIHTAVQRLRAEFAAQKP